MHSNTTLRTARPRVLYRRPRRAERMLYQLRYKHWFMGKDFSTDWTSYHFAVWNRVFTPLRDEQIRILEIGSWEGRSTIFFLNFFRRSTIACIDTFVGNTRERAYRTGRMADQKSSIEQRYDRNVARFSARIEKIKSESQPALEHLEAQDRKFDLAYIDGSHMRDDVTADSVGVWRLLASGGIIIWDDYVFGLDLPPEEQPKPAIDSFMREQEGRYRLLAKTKQVIIERLDCC
jgi:predicted O-methyltransferase YrrM